MTSLKFYLALSVIGFGAYYFRKWRKSVATGTKITMEKLNVYRKYGSWDRLTKEGQDYEKALFELDEWRIVADSLHSIELVRNGLTSAEFSERALKELKGICDRKAFDEIMLGITKS